MTLEDIYIENYPIVFGYLLSLCGDPVEAEELTAQTFLKAVENIRKYDKSCKPSTWLCTIARNLYFNEYRRKKRQVPLEEARFSVISPEEIYLKRTWQNASTVQPRPWKRPIGKYSSYAWKGLLSGRSV